MRKSVEIKKAIKNKKAEIEKFTNEGNFETAAALADDLNKMLDELKAAEAIEKSEEPEPENDAADDEEEDDKDSDTTNRAAFVPINRVSKSKKAKLRNRAFNKLVLGKKLTNEERRAYFNEEEVESTIIGQRESVDAEGGYLVPEEQMNKLREYRKFRLSLKPYCNIVPAKSKTGKMPTIGDEDGELFDHDELDDIPRDKLDFGQVKYEIHTNSDIILVSNELIADSDFEISPIIGKRFGIKAVNTENKKILALMDRLTPISVTGYKDFLTALNVKLDRAYYDAAKIFTNQDGLNWLETLEDKQGRPLLQPDVIEKSKYTIRGKEIIVMSNKQLKTESKVPFYIGNLAEYCMFAEREGIEISVSKEFAFDKNGTTFRVIERFGVSIDDPDAMIKLEVSAS